MLIFTSRWLFLIPPWWALPYLFFSQTMLGFTLNLLYHIVFFPSFTPPLEISPVPLK